MSSMERKSEIFGGYGKSIKSYGFQKGDEVRIITPDYEKGEKQHVQDYRLAKVVFVSDYFITAEAECITPDGTKVRSYSETDHRNPAKVRYTFDSRDLSLGHLIPAEKKERDRVAA